MACPETASSWNGSEMVASVDYHICDMPSSQSRTISRARWRTSSEIVKSAVITSRSFDVDNRFAGWHEIRLQMAEFVSLSSASGPARWNRISLIASSSAFNSSVLGRASQILIPSSPADASHSPSGLNVTVSVRASSFPSRCRTSLVPIFQTVTPLRPAMASRCPSGLNATLVTVPVCPFSVSRSMPLEASQTFTLFLIDKRLVHNALA